MPGESDIKECLESALKRDGGPIIFIFLEAGVISGEQCG
jgi:hypothetical protein